MGARYLRATKKEKPYNIDIDTLIERLRKVRALNCSPSDVGMDNYIFKKLSLNRSNMMY